MKINQDTTNGQTPQGDTPGVDTPGETPTGEIKIPSSSKEVLKHINENRFYGFKNNFIPIEEQKKLEKIIVYFTMKNMEIFLKLMMIYFIVIQVIIK